MKYRYLILALMAVAMVSCKDDAIPPVLAAPEVASDRVEGVSYHKAVIVDTVKLYNERVTIKLYYSTDKKIGTNACTGIVTAITPEVTKTGGDNTQLIARSVIDNLTDNTTYYYVYGFMSQYNEHCRGGKVTSYSEVRSFTTLKNGNPEVKTIGCSDIGFYSAVLSAQKVSDNADSKPTEWGVCYSTKSGVTVSNGTKMKSPSNDDVKKNFTLSNLTPNTTYYYRAYGINKYGTSYGEEKSFKTVDTSVLTMETGIPTEKGSNYAIVSASMTCNEGIAISERGFCYSNTNYTPTTEQDKTVNSGSGSGSFQGYITGLTPFTSYYVRAYAICQYGKVYGNVTTFTTER